MYNYIMNNPNGCCCEQSFCDSLLLGNNTDWFADGCCHSSEIDRLQKRRANGQMRKREKMLCFNAAALTAE